MEARVYPENTKPIGWIQHAEDGGLICQVIWEESRFSIVLSYSNEAVWRRALDFFGVTEIKDHREAK